jgi:hypothetical protein
MKKVFLSLAILFSSLFALPSFATLGTGQTPQSGNVYTIAYASVGVSSAAFTTVVASSPLYVSQIQACDTSGSIIELAKGTAGNEVPILVIPPNACGTFAINPILSQGSRLSLKQLVYSATTTSASVTAGYGTVGFLP